MEFNVLKRNGAIEKVSVSKIKDVIGWACKDLDVNSLALESKVCGFLREGIPTTEIHDNIIHHAQTLASAEEPDWVYVAGRLNTMRLWKDTGAYDIEFLDYFKDMVNSGTYSHPSLETYTEEDIKTLGFAICPEKDLNHSYGSTLTAKKKYLKKGETIQNMFMVEAMIIFGSRYSGEERLGKVIELYSNLSDRKISLATPWLSNLRSNGNISSCFIIAVDDNIDSITSSWGKAAKISKMGGGLGIYLGNLRSKGSIVGGRENAAKSVSSCVKVFNDIATYFDQGGSRAGAFTLALPVWHNDIDEFLEIQAESGDIRNKAYDIFPQITTPDLFWKQDEIQGDWYTFCPNEAKEAGLELNGCYGEEFEARYHELVKLAESSKIQQFTKHNSRDLVKKIMRTQFETGLPYVTFTDKLNEDNPNKHEGWIPCFNLCTESTSVLDPYNFSHTCLTGDTLVLTTEGLLPIVDCDGKDVVVPFEDDLGDKYTGKHKETAKLLHKGVKSVYEVTLSSGQKIKATADHKFLTSEGYKDVSEVRKGDLFRLPREALESLDKPSGDVDKPEARALGWILGDGWTREGNIGVCFAPEEVLAQNDVLQTLYQIHNATETLTGGRDKLPIPFVQENGVVNWQTKKQNFVDYFYKKYGLNPKLGKFKTLSTEILKESSEFKREMLSALFSADGSLVSPNNTRNKPYISYTSASEKLLIDVQNLLVEFGIFANYSFNSVKGRSTSQGVLSVKGEQNLINFHKFIGFNLSLNKQEKLDSRIDSIDSEVKEKKRMWTKVKSVTYYGEEEVYDLSLPQRHHFIANGLVSHNCNLASVVVGRCEDYKELQKTAELVAEVLDAGIELTSPPTECSSAHNNRYRTVGTGIQGYHDWVAKEWKSYLDKEEATKVAEYIQYGCVSKSIELAKELGAFPAFEGSAWDTGEMFDKFEARSVTDLDWNYLREQCKMYGIRNSQMTSPAPNTSTSVFMDAAAGVSPVYSHFFREDNDNGKYPISCMHLKENPSSYMRSFKTYNQSKLAEVIGSMQLFVDTGISAEYLLDQNKEDFSARSLYDVLTSSWKSGCKAVYYIRSIKKGESVDDLLGIKEGACSGCAG